MAEEELGKILVVTYEPMLKRLLDRILPEGDKRRVEIVSGVEQARQRLSDMFVAVVLTEWTKVNGAEVVKAAQDKGVRVVVMNGGLAPATELQAAGVDMISKPFGAEDLIAAIRGTLKGGSKPA